jgi:hypothetical protein
LNRAANHYENFSKSWKNGAASESYNRMKNAQIQYKHSAVLERGDWPATNLEKRAE